MHELAVTESLVDCVAENIGDARAVRLVIEIGKRAAVSASAVRSCFALCAKGTALEGAELEILEPPDDALKIRVVEVI
jgi:hydrogenase nickel incorporation protein HypA/HybF